MTVPRILWDGWPSVARVAVSVTVVYIAIVLVLRLVGQRALAKMSAYDLIVTVALGSLIAQIPLTKSISVVDGLVAIAAFLLLQELTSWAQARSSRVHHVVRERPRLVVWDGQFLNDRLLAINVTPDEVRGAIRRAGMVSLSQVQAVVLENDGEWAVMGRSDAPDLSAMVGLEIPDHRWPDQARKLWGSEGLDRPRRIEQGGKADSPNDELGAGGNAEKAAKSDSGEQPHTGSGGVV